jgi:hypothetical protein
MSNMVKGSEIREVLLSSEGRWFTACFMKRTTGELREMTCRTGVAKYVKGIGMAYDAKSKNLLTVWEPIAGKADDAYRSINLDAVVWAKVDGKLYTVDNG